MSDCQTAKHTQQSQLSFKEQELKQVRLRLEELEQQATAQEGVKAAEAQK